MFYDGFCLLWGVWLYVYGYNLILYLIKNLYLILYVLIKLKINVFEVKFFRLCMYYFFLIYWIECCLYVIKYFIFW